MPGVAAAPETCYRHGDRSTRVRCTRCNRPICPDCMTPAAVGHHCPVCVAEGRREGRRARPIRLRRPQSAAMVLLGANVAVFLVELAMGGATDTRVLIRMGAMVPALVAEGEYWRLLTAIFLHVGLYHVAFNAFALVVFGSLVEQVYGTVRFLAIYFVSGFVASAASFAFGDLARVAVGASGAVFGLLGAWVAYNLRRRSLSLAQSNIQAALLLIGINLALGFVIPGIDNLAHMGGLAAGVAAGLAADGFGRRAVREASRVGGLLAVTLIGVVLVAWRVTALT